MYRKGEDIVEKIVSATEARVRFGEMMDFLTQSVDPIIVERAGNPQIVMLSIQQYRRLQRGQEPTADWVDQVKIAHAKIAAESSDRELPEPADVIREMREIRDDHLMDLC